MKASDVGQGKWPVIMVMGEAWEGSSQDTDVEGSPGYRILSETEKQVMRSELK